MVVDLPDGHSILFAINDGIYNILFCQNFNSENLK
jgi:hypothetical protein